MESKQTLAARIAGNLGFSGLAVAISKISQLALFILIARSLGAEGLGQYAYAISLVLLVATLSDLGISQFGVSQVAGKQDQTYDYMDRIFGLRLVLSFLGLGLIFAIGLWMPLSPATRTLVYLIGAGNFFI
ncbi:MAG: oligosaccharide flippase family protein, partial [candidate division Zixibacteria bacterium]|nr:oligosaccharide flippase family protein [candidate division Zixibacteria bacterium]